MPLPRIGHWCVGLAAIAATACTNVESVVPDANANVRVGEYFMTPDTVAIDRGQVVRWTNTGAAYHQMNVVLPDTTFRSVPLPPGWWFEVRFDAPGTFAVFCSQLIAPDDTVTHPETSTVVVR